MGAVSGLAATVDVVPPRPEIVPYYRDGQIEADLETLRRSLPTIIVGPGTAELWLAFGRIERALAAPVSPDCGLDDLWEMMT